jgi:hypothetical protein
METNVEESLARKADELNRRESMIEMRERYAGVLFSKEELALIAEAIKVYKIPKEYVFSTSIDQKTKEAKILTYGGRKVRHRKGEPAREILTPVQITGKAHADDVAWYEKINQKIPIKFFKTKG